MKQQLFDKNDRTKTLAEIQRDKNPTVWECGRKFKGLIGIDYEDVNGKPDFSKKKLGRFEN